MKMKIIIALLLVGYVGVTGSLGQRLDEPFQDANGKYGYKDSKGKVVIQPQFAVAYEFKNDLAMVAVPDPDVDLGLLYFLIDPQGRQVTKDKYQRMNLYGGLYRVEAKRKFGFVSVTGRELLAPTYDYINENNYKGYPDGIAAANLNGKWGLIDTSGKVLVPLTYERIDDCVEGLCAAYVNKAGGYINAKGAVAIPMIYKSVFPFDNGYAWACKPEGCSIIDKAGRALTPFQYQFNGIKMTATFHDGFAPVYLNRKLGFINLKGEEVIPCIYDYNATGNYDFFVNGKARVRQNGKEIFIDKPRDTPAASAVPLPVIAVTKTLPAKTVVSRGKLSTFTSASSNKIGYRFDDGSVLVEPKYDSANKFVDGMALVNIGRSATEGGKWGFIDETGKETIALKYDAAKDFSEGFAAVNVGGRREPNGMFLGGKWFFIDKTGKEVFAARYDYASSFRDGVAVVAAGQYPAQRYGLIDKTGKQLAAPKYQGIWDTFDGLKKVMSGAKFGFIDMTGKEVIAPVYAAADNFRNGKAKVVLNGRTFYIDKTGAEVP